MQKKFTIKIGILKNQINHKFQNIDVCEVLEKMKVLYGFSRGIKGNSLKDKRNFSALFQ